MTVSVARGDVWWRLAAGEWPLPAESAMAIASESSISPPSHTLPIRRVIIALLLVISFASGGPSGLSAALASPHDHFEPVHAPQTLELGSAEPAAIAADCSPDLGAAEPSGGLQSHHHHGDASAGVLAVAVEDPVILVTVSHKAVAACGKLGVLGAGLERPPRIAV